MADSKKPKEVSEEFGFVGGDALKVILDKEPGAVTGEERDILRARKDYLTEEQIEDYELEDGESGEEGGDDGEEAGDDREAELKAMSSKDLKEVAKELDVAGRSKLKGNELVAAILEVEQADTEEGEEGKEGEEE